MRNLYRRILRRLGFRRTFRNRIVNCRWYGIDPVSRFPAHMRKPAPFASDDEAIKWFLGDRV